MEALVNPTVAIPHVRWERTGEKNLFSVDRVVGVHPWMFVCTLALLFATTTFAQDQNPTRLATWRMNAQETDVVQDLVPLSEARTPALGTVISLHLEDATLEEALKHISKKADLDLIYGSQKVAVGKKVTLDVEKITAREALQEVLRDTGLRLMTLPGGQLVVVNRQEVKTQDVQLEPVAQPSLDVEKLVPAGLRGRERPQTGAIAGTVTDAETGQALPGVNVVVVGTQQGAATDAQGQYEITGIEPGTYDVRASFVGYREKTLQDVTVRPDETTTVDITLAPSAVAMEEVIAIGYGEEEKRYLTGSVSSVSSEEVQSVPTTSFDQALEGQVAGVQVTQASPAPGGGVEVRIRGTNTIRGDTQPLYVIDGVQINTSNVTVFGAGTQGISTASQNPLSGISPSDIESIDILKGNAATAIYGSRGANGVVLVNTKGGSEGRMRVNYNASYGFQQVANRYELLNAQEYAMLVNEARENDGQEPLFGENPQFPDPTALDEGTDWQDAVFAEGQSAPVMDHQVSVSGGNEDVEYFVSGNYHDMQGLVRNSRFQRAGIRMNVTADVTSKLRMGGKVSFSRSINDLSMTGSSPSRQFTGPLAGALLMPPTTPIKNEDGTFALNQVPNGILADNPVTVSEEINQDQVTDRFIGNGFVEYTITEGLTVEGSFGADVSESDRDGFFPSTTLIGQNFDGLAKRSSISNLLWTLKGNVNYQETFNEVHQIETLVGFEAQQQKNSSFSAASSGFASDVFGSDALGLGVDVISPVSSRNKWSLLSYLGRIKYVLGDRYVLTFTGRADGSSKFGENNRWAFFPSISAAWRLGSEDFMQGVDRISSLKLRASYGSSGQSGDAYQSLARFGGNFYPLGNGLVQGFVPENVPNPDLKWETTTSFNLGIEAGLWDGRFTLVADYFQEETDDLLLSLPVPSNSGFSSALQNAGELQNRGFELTVGATPVDADLTWSIDGNISFDRNEVQDLAGKDDFIINNTLVREGEPLGQWYMLEFDGVFQTPEQLEAGPEQPGAQVGDARFVDQNGDGIINEDDRTIVGNSNPDFAYGLSSELSYKRFDFRVNVTGEKGKDVLNQTRGTLGSLDMSTNQIREVALDRWTPTNTDTNVPRATFSSNGLDENSSYLVEDGSYLRIRNVTLGYRIPALPSTIREARVYVSINNVHTFTDYSGFDPDVSSNSVGGIVSGVDNFAFPRARRFTIGVNLGL